jgi:hypothetical protein
VLWLYWNRWRSAVLVAGLSLASVAALVIVAGSVTGTGQPPARRTVTGRIGAQLRSAPFDPDAARVRRGVQLLSAAALACQTVTYSGVQIVAWWGSSGASASLIQVWHRPGGPALDKGDDDDGPPSAALPPGTGDDAAEGVLSFSVWMLSLMRANYLIEYVGTASASDRPAAVVAVRRGNGRLAARFWLDTATDLPLRRELYDSVGQLVSEGAFIDLKIGDREVGKVPPVGAQPWSAQSAVPGLASLRSQGWSLPATLAGNMTLVAVTRTGAQSGTVVDASYSDGLSVVSVFMQRGQLPRTLPGWHLASVRGQEVYLGDPDGRSLAWSAHGFVYTVLADAPPATVQRVVADLPHDPQIGFWDRLARGLKRMGSWFNPFG